MSVAGQAPTVCFDATGTLIEPTESVGEIYHRVALEHGVDLPAWRLDDAFRRVLRHAPARGLEGATVKDRRESEVAWWFERIRQTFQATDSTARFDDFPGFAQALFDLYATREAWRPRSGIPETLTTLKASRCYLAVVSNFDHRLPEILEHLDLASFFSTIQIPSETARSKPDRTLFENVASLAGKALDGLVYVGDDSPDVLEAIANLGLRVIDVRTLEFPSKLTDLILDASSASSAAILPAPSASPGD